MGRNSPLNPKDKANVFNQFFRSVFNHPKGFDNLSSIPGHACDYSNVLSVHPIHDLTCTPREVLKVLNISKCKQGLWTSWDFPAVAKRVTHGTISSIFDQAL